ncbi:MAG: GntR family transcriptional regulator [Eubacteriales bacterium]|jgi:DNA-binding GntR family transcriptional regulator
MADMLSRSCSGDVIEDLRLKIVLQKYRQGDRLIELALAKEYGVSRGTLRSALQALESEGMIETLPNGGKQVVGFTRKYAMDMYNVRKTLEFMAIEEIMEMKTLNYAMMVDTLKLLEDHCHASQMTRDGACRLDTLFHRAVVSLSDNRTLIKTWDTLAPLNETLLKLNSEAHYRSQYIEEFYDKHKAILDMILLRDRKVLEFIDQHLEMAKDLTTNMLKQLGG